MALPSPIHPQRELLFQDLKHFSNNWKWSKLKSNFVPAFAKLRRTKHETQGITASNFLQFAYGKMLKAEIIGVWGRRTLMVLSVQIVSGREWQAEFQHPNCIFSSGEKLSDTNWLRCFRMFVNIARAQRTSCRQPKHLLPQNQSTAKVVQSSFWEGNRNYDFWFGLKHSTALRDKAWERAHGPESLLGKEGLTPPPTVIFYLDLYLFTF